MANSPDFDVIIIGGSYAGLSAALALGRAIRQVLVIDSGQPCNRQTPHSHNFITQDGNTPAQIAATAKDQVLLYHTVRFYRGKANRLQKLDNGFEIGTESGAIFSGRKLIFATGVTDSMPPIPGFAECWGISVLHCPYCHGYEVRNEPMGLFGNGDLGFEFCRLISNWSKNLTLFTNGPSTLTLEQTTKIKQHNIPIIETEIEALEHEGGYLKQVVLANGSRHPVTAVFARPAFAQHSDLPAQAGCAFTEMGHIQVDDFQRTTVPGIYAAGDATVMFRTVSMAAAGGTKAGAIANNELIVEDF